MEDGKEDINKEYARKEAKRLLEKAYDLLADHQNDERIDSVMYDIYEAINHL